MKKHLKPVFHLAVGAVLAIMFAQQSRPSSLSQSDREQLVQLTLQLEEDTRTKALAEWRDATTNSLPEIRASSRARYVDLLGQLEDTRQTLAREGVLPRPPTAAEQMANAQVAAQGMQVIPPNSKENIDLATKMAAQKAKEQEDQTQSTDNEKQTDEAESDEASKDRTDAPASEDVSKPEPQTAS